VVAITELLEREIARLKTLPNDEQDAIALFPPTATKPEPLALRLNPLPAVGESHPVGFALLRDRQYAANPRQQQILLAIPPAQPLLSLILITPEP
jgi:hypothetical protein